MRPADHRLGVALVALALAFAASAGPARAQDAGGPEAGGGEGGGALAGHVMVEVDRAAVRVTEVYLVVPAARIDPSGEAVWIPLPEDAAEVEVERGEDLLRVVPGGLALAAALEPGRSALAFSYLVPAEGGRAELTHTLPFSVEAFHVMWPAGSGAEVRAMGFADAGLIQAGPRQVQVLERTGFGAGDRLAIATESRPLPPAAAPGTGDPLGPVRPVTLALAVLLLLAGLVLPAARGRSGGEPG